ncbi:MAG: hypothetical protein A2V77_14090 [Anaeromyxobacter sp. RBG_16_69_14]|nr:MAG: hypothetical protein A2V77_14090 [Anaeromyxobacter sp. RBG_16_69_14]
MIRHLYNVGDVEAMIRGGSCLLLAGDERILRELPRGKWIAGTIPYFMADAGGVVDRQHIFVNELPEGLQCAGVRCYSEKDIDRVYSDIPANEFGVLIAPAGSKVHLAFATKAPSSPKFASRPLIGWIAGVHLSDLATATPSVFDGTSGEVMDQRAVVMHVSLPRGKVAEVGILNIFTAGDGSAITFPSTGFSCTDAEIDGCKENLARFVQETGLDTRLPLVADYRGAAINVSFQAVDQAKGEVRFFAPVFAGVRYRHARPISSYVEAFLSALPKGLDERIVFSCNCILNYLHSGLEGRTTGGIVGPITFGEVAYQLVNQTMAYVTIEDARRSGRSKVWLSS